jgi:hypothetical protein
VDSIAVEVDIDHGKLTARQPHLLPERGTGLLTILADRAGTGPPRSRIKLPIIRCAPRAVLNPTAEELDESLWG